MDAYVYWLAPLLICLFMMLMLGLGIVLCYKLRSGHSAKPPSQSSCTCKRKVTVKSRAKSFLASSIFFTQTSELAVDGPMYRKCDARCCCNHSGSVSTSTRQQHKGYQLI